jgi:hypothetical protein
MCSLSLNNNIYKIELLHPNFKKALNYYQRKVNNNTKLDDKHKNVKLHTKELSFFDIPINTTKKIKILLGEINKLADNAFVIHSNLIANQLRAILALTLVHYWAINKKAIVDGNIDGLKAIISYTINKSRTEKLKKANDITNELEDLRKSKVKELADDVAHCDYSTVGGDITEDFAKRLKHLLSLIYGR